MAKIQIQYDEVVPCSIIDNNAGNWHAEEVIHGYMVTGYGGSATIYAITTFCGNAQIAITTFEDGRISSMVHNYDHTDFAEPEDFIREIENRINAEIADIEKGR